MEWLVRRRVTWSGVLGVVASMALAGVAGAQEVKEFPFPESGRNPSQIVVGPDRALWFTVPRVTLDSPSFIGRMTTRGRYTESRLPDSAGDPVRIAAGPDGALWFTESVGRIGRITTAGEITEFPLPVEAGVGPRAWGIAAGPDRALWFTAGRRVGRMTTDGDVMTYPVPLPFDFGVGDIVAGPDGALWFTAGADFDNGWIGRITTAGEASIVTVTDCPGSLTAGPDRALWWTINPGCSDPGDFESAIGRVTTAGEATKFRVPGSRPGGLAAGPDRALYFTESSLVQRSKIGRMTTAGKIARVPLRPGRFPWDIVAGPDGAMWFTARGESTATGPRRSWIGRVTTFEPRVSAELSPRTGCASSAVKARIQVTGGARLARVDISLDGRRLRRENQRDFRVRISVRRLRSGTHTLRVRAVDTKGRRHKVALTFLRCG